MAATDIDSLKSILKFVVDAFNDTENAFGEDGSKADKWAAYGDLVPDILNVIPKVGEVPTEVGELSPDDIGALVDTAKDGLSLPEGHAKDIVGSVITLVHDVLDKVGDVSKLAKLIKGKKEAVKDMTPAEKGDQSTPDGVPAPAKLDAPGIQ